MEPSCFVLVARVGGFDHGRDRPSSQVGNNRDHSDGSHREHRQGVRILTRVDGELGNPADRARGEIDVLNRILGSNDVLVLGKLGQGLDFDEAPCATRNVVNHHRNTHVGDGV